MLLPFAALWRPGWYVEQARMRPMRWHVTLLAVILPWLALCAAGQLLGLLLFPPGLPPEGMPSLPAYGAYSTLVIWSYAAGVGWLGSLLGEAFDGRIDPDAGFAAVAAAAVPLGLAKLISSWPVAGWLAWPLLGWAGWLLYRGLGPALRLTGGRLAHCFSTLLGALLVAIAIGWQLRDLIPGAAPAVRMGRLWLV